MQKLFLVFCFVATAHAQPKQKPTALPAVKPTPTLAKGMAKLSFMRGVWQGPASGTAMDGTKYATVKADSWREVGEYIAKDKPPIKTFEMNLKKVGDTDWPLAAPIQPR